MENPHDIRDYDDLPSCPAGTVFVSMFVGHVVTRDIVEAADRRLERVKAIPIAATACVSPHIVDLKPVPERQASGVRGQGHDFEQHLAIWGHKIWRTIAPRFRDEYRHIALERGPREAYVLKRKSKLPAPPIKKLAAQPMPAFKTISLEKTVAAKPQPSDLNPQTFRFSLPANWHRHVFGFAVLAVLITVPIHLFSTYAGLAGGADAVIAKTKDAIGHLKEAGASVAGPGGSATENFEDAAATFAATRSKLRGATVTLGALVTGKTDKLESGKRLLEAGEALSKAGAELSAAFDTLEAGSELPLTRRVSALSDALGGALPKIEGAVAALEGIDPKSVPKGFRPTFIAARADLASVTADLKRFTDSSGIILRLLGAEGKRRYLVVFQNDRELRPTGGFIGSFALMDVDDGEIMNMEVPAGGSYDLRGGLNERVAAPDQLRLVNPRWEFQDANWFADFPSSARSLSWFYEKSGGPTIDGVLAVTTGFMENLLKVMGPVDMPEYKKTLTSENFFLETQKAVELEYDKAENKPKQIISDMAPKVLEKLVAGGAEHLLPLSNAVSRALASKDIQMYFKDTDEQAVAAEFGWTGELKPLPSADFLAVIDSNIAGGKTDGVIGEDIRHETEIAEDGGLIDTVSVTRSHRGVPGEAFTGVKNIDYIRFYVPEGSELLEAEGFERPGEGYFLNGEDLEPSKILAATEGAVRFGWSGTRVTNESGMTVFGNWVQVEPGEKRTVRVRYRLPFKLDDLANEPETDFQRFLDRFGLFVATADLKLVVHKQAGARERNFSTSIRLPRDWKIRSRVPESASVVAGRLTYSAPLERDLYVGLLVSNED